MKSILATLGIAACLAVASGAFAADGRFDPRDPNSLTRHRPERPYALTCEATQRSLRSETGSGEPARKPRIEWGPTSSHRQVRTGYDR